MVAGAWSKQLWRRWLLMKWVRICGLLVRLLKKLAIWRQFWLICRTVIFCLSLEIHRLGEISGEILYSAMEDLQAGYCDWKRSAARSIQSIYAVLRWLAVTRTEVGGTFAWWDSGIYRLEFYAKRCWNWHGTKDFKNTNSKWGGSLLSTRARLTPRIANRLLKQFGRLRADVNGDEIIDETTIATLEVLEVDELGIGSGWS